MNEIEMLLIGAALGAQAMNVQHARWARQDARRSAAASRAALKRAAGDQYLQSLRLYQLQQRTGARR